MKTIALTQGKVALVDDEDWEWLSKFKWFAHRKNSRVVAERCYKIIRSGRSKSGWHNMMRTMQTEIMGVKPGFEIDHRNRDSLDNQRDNLRWATRSQNVQNRCCPNKLGFTGVRQDGLRFIARITPNRKTITLGRFSKPEEAARAYNEAARLHFGEFARLNPI